MKANKIILSMFEKGNDFHYGHFGILAICY